MRIFIYLITFVLSSHIFSASADSDEVCPDKWSIYSAGLSISWGAVDDNNKYISVVDFRYPHNSLLILPDGVTGKSKDAFIKIHQTAMQESKTGLIEEGEAFLKTLADFYPPKLTPVEDDRALVEMMTSNYGLIWTGAGISSRSGIPTLLELYKKLGLNSIPFAHMVEEYSLRQLATRIYPIPLQDVMFDFLAGVFKKRRHEPSPAHIAIKDILTLTKSHYITSNLDGLERSAGYAETVEFDRGDSKASATLKVRSSKSDFVPKWLLIVGLRADDYCIAAWASSKGISIYYVGPNAPELADGYTEKTTLTSVNWIKADAHTYLPALLEKLRHAKK